MPGDSTTIWELVKSCAEKLTAQGRTPFRRDDIIECVQSHAPRYGHNSINPVIQGVTVNLRGGAPGAVGKDILFSVGRGLFVLNRDVELGASAEEVRSAPRVASRPRRIASAARLSGETPTLSFPQTMFVLPCSGRKLSSVASCDGQSITEFLPTDIAREILTQRDGNAVRSEVDASSPARALDRYDGMLYQIARPAMEDLMREGAHLLILSGGYGVVLATEPIGMYNAVFRASMWDERIVERSLAAYAARAGVNTVIGVLSASTGYATVFHRVQWPANISQVLLLSPQRSTGAMVKAPRAQGEALVAIAESGRLAEGWRSSDGLAMEVTRIETG